MTFEQHANKIAAKRLELEEAIAAAREDEIFAELSVVQPKETLQNMFIFITLSKGVSR